MKESTSLECEQWMLLFLSFFFSTCQVLSEFRICVFKISLFVSRSFTHIISNVLLFIKYVLIHVSCHVSRARSLGNCVAGSLKHFLRQCCSVPAINYRFQAINTIIEFRLFIFVDVDTSQYSRITWFGKLLVVFIQNALNV